MNIDIPTAITDAETKKLQEICARKHVLEIGALLGYSTVVMGHVAERVVSIDPHEGYPQDNPRSTWLEYLDNLITHDVRHKVLPIRATWQEAFGTVPSDALYPYEVLFIDLDGTYGVTQECLAHFAGEWGWALKTIAVHDCGHPDWPGVDRAVEWMKLRLGPYHYTFEQVDRLGVFHYV